MILSNFQNQCSLQTHISGKRLVHPRKLPVFYPKKIHESLPENASPYDVFELGYISDEVAMMVLETNRSAAQFMRPNLSRIKWPKSGIFTNSYWVGAWGRVILQVAVEKKFSGKYDSAPLWKKLAQIPMLGLGLLIHMGLLYKPGLSMYWSVDELFHTALRSYGA